MTTVIRVRRLVGRKIYEREARRGGWLTTDEPMRLLGVSRRQVFSLRSRGTLHARKGTVEGLA